jgi:hypothetical protein
MNMSDIPHEPPPPATLVVTSEGELHGEDTPENRELSRRVRACVNACAGIPTEELENGIVADMCRVLNEVVPVLQRQNSERRSA